MAKIIAVVNQKGGVGKTTTAVNLSAALHDLGKRVLLCDFDPQANSTSGMGVDKNTASPNIYDVLINGAEPAKAVVRTRYGDVLPSNKALAGAGIEMIAIDNRERLLKTALDALSGDYDYIFIDCPPSLELLTVNALCAAGSLLVPVQCEYYALEGLSDLLATVRLVKRGLNPALSLEGVLLTMFDSRTNLSLQVAEEVKRHFPGQVYATVIPRNVRLSEAPSHGRPISAYDPYSRGAEAFRCWRMRSHPSANLIKEYGKRSFRGSAVWSSGSYESISFLSAPDVLLWKRSLLWQNEPKNWGWAVVLTPCWATRTSSPKARALYPCPFPRSSRD